MNFSQKCHRWLAGENAPATSDPGIPWWHALFQPVDGAGLAMFRIGFGLMMLFEVVDLVMNRRIGVQWVQPDFHFTYFGFSWVKPLPGNGMYFHVAIMAVFALCITLGWFYRIVSVVFFVLITYLFLLEQALYLNHFYLICLISGLMMFLPANRVYALDAKRQKTKQWQVPAWTIWLLRVQLGIVFFYAAIAKLDPDWLSGLAMKVMLGNRVHFPVVGPLFDEPWFIMAMTYGGLLLDLCITGFLIWPRSRKWAYLVAACFHLSNAWLFHIGIFPWFMMMAAMVFFEPSWPRRFFKSRKRSSKKRKKGKASPEERPVVFAAKPLVAALLASYLLLQLVIPFRHWLYPGHVTWTEEGHRFSWRMKLRVKASDRAALFLAKDPKTGREWAVDLGAYFQLWQISRMATKPDQILQAAHHIAADLRAKGYPAIEIRARCKVSLNRRPYRLLVDPNVDLAAQPRNLSHAGWITVFQP